MSPWRHVAVTAVMLVCVLALPVTVLAGGWLVMTLDELPAADLPAGQEIAIGFVARQHGVRPLNDVDAVLTFTHQASGRLVRVDAVQQGPTGHFVARFTPPAAGVWDWSIHAWNADHPMPPLTVAPAAASAPASATVEPVSRRWPLLAGAGVLALVGVLGLVAAWRGRSAAPRRAWATDRPQPGD